jgi:hypothetical protein
MQRRELAKGPKILLCNLRRSFQAYVICEQFTGHPDTTDWWYRLR